MANETGRPNWPGPRISHNEFAARLAARRMAHGAWRMAHGGRATARTESKKAMLKTIADLGGKW